MKKELFVGCGTALITPFKNNRVDYYALEKLLVRQIEANVKAIIVLGTTGEPCTLCSGERENIIKFCRQVIPKEIKMIVGTGGNNTAEAIKKSKQAQNLGADGLLVVTPYYNKCTDNGLYLHYQKIANAVTLPIIVYNVPGRTGVNITPEMALKLSTVKNIVGIKEASGNISQANKLFSLLKDKMAIYCGEDELNYTFLCLGASGLISVLSNIVPKETQKLCDYVFGGKYRKGLEINNKYYSLSKKLFLETNPIPVKAASNMLNLCNNELRLPLCKMGYENSLILKEELKTLGLIKNDCM